MNIPEQKRFFNIWSHALFWPVQASVPKQKNTSNCVVLKQQLYFQLKQTNETPEPFWQLICLQGITFSNKFPQHIPQSHGLTSSLHFQKKLSLLTEMSFFENSYSCDKISGCYQSFRPVSFLWPMGSCTGMTRNFNRKFDTTSRSGKSEPQLRNCLNHVSLWQHP